MPPTDSLILALLFCLLAVLASASIRSMLKSADRYRDERRRRLGLHKSTYFLDRNTVDDTCDICFGEFEKGDVAVCGCGMKFHRECVEMTGECPYCNSSPETMEYRGIIRPVCPSCGGTVDGNVCRACGTVLPNGDMTFRCVCGSSVYAGDGVCPDCGAEYGFTYRRSGKRK